MQLRMTVNWRNNDPRHLIVKALESAEPAKWAERVAVRSYKARAGGKAAGAKLLKPVRAGKRADFLRWFLADPKGRTVPEAMSHFGMTRQNVMAYWTAIHRYHGIGYALADARIMPLPPAKCHPSSIFGASHGA